MNKMKFLTLGLCLTIVGAVLGSIIGKSAVGAAIGGAVGYIAGALISNYMDKNQVIIQLFKYRMLNFHGN